MKLAYVEWVDAVSIGTGGWVKLRDVEKLTPDLVRSVGWVVEETQEYLTMISHNGDNEVAGEFCIPKTCIRKRRILKCPI